MEPTIYANFSTNSILQLGLHLPVKWNLDAKTLLSSYLHPEYELFYFSKTKYDYLDCSKFISFIILPAVARLNGDTRTYIRRSMYVLISLSNFREAITRQKRSCLILPLAKIHFSFTTIFSQACVTSRLTRAA